MTAATTTPYRTETLRTSILRRFLCKKRFSVLELLIIVLLANTVVWGKHDVDLAMAATTALQHELPKSNFGGGLTNVRNVTSTMNVGRSASKRNKKIIVFSLFSVDSTNPLPAYLEKGVWENIKGYHFYFPDWICRFYVTKNIPIKFIQDLIASPVPVEVVLMDEWGTSFEETRLQRFLPFDDPEVSHVLSRDIDSRPSVRDFLAVNEWLGSPRKFHTMRDHQQHAVAVMAGMFGWKAGALGDLKIVDLLQDFRRSSSSQKNDQVFLERYIWPVVKADAFQHDGHPDKPWSKRFCRQSPGGCHAFPMSNAYGGFFVGQPFKAGIGGNVEQYHCFSTCSVTAELECNCRTKTCGGKDVTLQGTGESGKQEDWGFQQATSKNPTKDPVCLRQPKAV
ncbi:lipoxygenase [Nitzschia inconspicua]|uniref:Lipoxygenase n=1 Tax=Nitzschia inconspicua TaxID=303405 RepID=A0A9K3KTE5_9STRA|nr:lipoxygenase [Nitzschia inconspicua]